MTVLECKLDLLDLKEKISKLKVLKDEQNNRPNKLKNLMKLKKNANETIEKVTLYRKQIKKMVGIRKEIAKQLKELQEIKWSKNYLGYPISELSSFAKSASELNSVDNDILNNSNICFVIGCQRSGTTMASLILESHPDVIGYEEEVSYDFWKEKSILVKEIIEKKNLGKNCFVFKMPEITEQLNNPNFFLLTRGTGPSFFKYENQSLIFLIRDPRDVSLSLRKRGQDPLGTWTRELIIWIEKIFPKVIPEFKKKYYKELEIMENSEKYSLVAKDALFWKVKNDAFFEYNSLGYKILPIFYEDFVTSPKNNIQKICKFLNISFNENMLRHHEINHDKFLRRDGKVHGTDPRRPIDSKAVQYYKDQMIQEEQEMILSICGDTYKKMQDLREKMLN